MRKCAFLIIAFWLLLGVTACQSSGANNVNSNSDAESRTNCDFRNSKWGDSIQTVKEYTTDLDFTGETDVGLMAETIVCGYNAYTIYQFDNDMLHAAMYIFDLGSSRGGQYITAFNTIKEAVIEKYGQPYSDVISPLTNQGLIDIAGEAAALEPGYVAYITEWSTDRSEITESAIKQNGTLLFSLMYTDNDYEPTTDNGI